MKLQNSQDDPIQSQSLTLTIEHSQQQNSAASFSKKSNS